MFMNNVSDLFCCSLLPLPFTASLAVYVVLVFFVKSYLCINSSGRYTLLSLVYVGGSCQLQTTHLCPSHVCLFAVMLARFSCLHTTVNYNSCLLVRNINTRS